MDRRRFIRQAAAYGGSVATAGGVEPAAAQTQVTHHLVLTARDLGAGNGKGDDGAILTAAIERSFGTLASSQSTTPITIDFGDGQNVYNLQSPIVVQQNHIRLVGNGAVLSCRGDHAIVGAHADSANILFGFQVSGFTLKGQLQGDAILIRSGSQCAVEGIRNYGKIDGALVHFTGVTSSRSRDIKSDGEFGSSCRHVIRESVYEKTRGQFVNCIANAHDDLLGYACTGAGAFLAESDAFSLSGDFEVCAGPGVDVLNCRFGTLSIYAEKNGQAASKIAADTPDDIRIRSAQGKLISRSSNITIFQTVCGGEWVAGIVPNSVHIAGADECLIIANALAGNMRIERGSIRNTLGAQARFIGQLLDEGTGTIDLMNGLISRSPIGYRKGAGGSVVQSGGKSTTVTLNTLSGEVAIHPAPLAARSEVLFRLTNNQIEPDDEISVWRKSGGTGGAYTLRVDSVANGSCVIVLENRSSATLAEQVIIGFAIRKAAAN